MLTLLPKCWQMEANKAKNVCFENMASLYILFCFSKPNQQHLLYSGLDNLDRLSRQYYPSSAICCCYRMHTSWNYDLRPSSEYCDRGVPGVVSVGRVGPRHGRLWAHSPAARPQSAVCLAGGNSEVQGSRLGPPQA